MYPLTVLIHVPSLLLLLLSGISLDYTILAHDFVHMDLDTYMKEERRYYRWDINTAARYRHTPSHASSHPTCQHTLSYIYPPPPFERMYLHTNVIRRAKQAIDLVASVHALSTHPILLSILHPILTLLTHPPTYLSTLPSDGQSKRSIWSLSCMRWDLLLWTYSPLTSV